MNTILNIYHALLYHYGKQGWWPTISKNQRFEIILGTILTQNTSWKNVEKAIFNFNKLNIIRRDAIKQLSEKDLASLIKSTGYYNQKARKIKVIIQFLESGKEINRENLLEVWGIGQETADSILLYAYSQPFFVIDTYTKRIMSRLGFQQQKYEDLQALFHKSLPQDNKLFNEYHALLVRLGKETCKTKPKCHKCPLNKTCKKII